MSERVQQLLHEVRRAAAEEDYKTALAERFPGAHQQGLQSLQREIAEEIAVSLGRAGKKVQRSLFLLHQLLDKAAHAQLSPSERSALRVVFLEERRLAERHLRDLLIQREALGFRRHDDVKQRYALPAWSVGVAPSS